MLTLERVDGINIGDLPALDAVHIDREKVINVAIDAIVQMVFTDGFFHGDPHPGNLFVQPDSTIALIDFGMVGRIDDDLRPRLLAVFNALAAGDVGHVAHALVRLCTHRGPLDLDALRDDVGRFVRLFRGRAPGEVKLPSLISALLALLRRHRLQLPADVVLLTRVLLILDGLGTTLDPKFDLSSALQSRSKRLMAIQSSPRALFGRAKTTAEEFVALGIELPDTVSRIVDELEANGLEVHLRVRELEPLVDRLEQIGTRVVSGIVASALIGGIAQSTATTPGRRWTGANGGLLGAAIGATATVGGYLIMTTRRRRGRTAGS